jgi:hypothetical protein
MAEDRIEEGIAEGRTLALEPRTPDRVAVGCGELLRGAPDERGRLASLSERAAERLPSRPIPSSIRTV